MVKGLCPWSVGSKAETLWQKSTVGDSCSVHDTWEADCNEGARDKKGSGLVCQGHVSVHTSSHQALPPHGSFSCEPSMGGPIDVAGVLTVQSPTRSLVTCSRGQSRLTQADSESSKMLELF